MASPTQWTWVWVNCGSLWCTGRPGVLQFLGSQRVRHYWVTELNCGKLLKSTISVVFLQVVVWIIYYDIKYLEETHFMQSVFLFFFLEQECWVRNQVLRNSPVVKTPPSNAGSLNLKPGLSSYMLCGMAKKKKTPVKRDQILGSWELREHWGNDCSEDSLEMKNKDNLGLGMNSLSDNFLPNSYTPVLPVFREGGLCDGAPEHRTMAIFISHVSSTGKLDKSGLICGHFCVVF